MFVSNDARANILVFQRQQVVPMATALHIPVLVDGQIIAAVRPQAGRASRKKGFFYEEQAQSSRDCRRSGDNRAVSYLL